MAIGCLHKIWLISSKTLGANVRKGTSPGCCYLARRRTPVSLRECRSARLKNAASHCQAKLPLEVFEFGQIEALRKGYMVFLQSLATLTRSK